MMPRGVSQKTPERLALVLHLRNEVGMGYQAIADTMGLSYKTVWNWCDDPDGSKKRTRIDRYRRPCSECGQPTDGSGGYKAGRALCTNCYTNEVWDRDAIIKAINAWADEHGGIPPSVNQWQNAKRGGADLPVVTVVINKFETWNKAIIAAGFEPHPSGPVGGGYKRLTPHQRRIIARLYAQGWSSVDLAHRYEVSTTTVLATVRRLGVPIRPSSFTNNKLAATDRAGSVAA